MRNRSISHTGLHLLDYALAREAAAPTGKHPLLADASGVPPTIWSSTSGRRSVRSADDLPRSITRVGDGCARLKAIRDGEAAYNQDHSQNAGEQASLTASPYCTVIAINSAGAAGAPIAITRYCTPSNI